FKKDIVITPSMCDSTGYLSVPHTFTVFQDLAAESADALGVGFKGLGERGLFWLTAKTIVRFYRRPFMSDVVTLTSWPERPDGLKCYRDYTMTCRGEVLIAGKTLWAIIDQKKGELHKVEEAYPEGIILRDDIALSEDFSRLRPGLKDMEIGKYTVKSTDIDVGHHMNNVAYIHAFASMFSVDQWESMNYPIVEAHFKNQCFEGDILTFYHIKEDGLLRFEATRGDGKTALQIVMRDN
ncbi:MAG: thioesterase, partial [Lachnospiraceae bacterium]|nr:thioesterase [Lachnospiraceae bacterium]